MDDGLSRQKTPLLIIGGGQHAAVVRDCVDEALFKVLGYLDDGQPAGAQLGTEAVLGRLDDLPALILRHSGLVAVIAIGDNMTRRRIAERATEVAARVEWATIIHRSAIVSASARIGAGTVVVAGAIINCHSRLGRHMLINTGSLIDHDNHFGDYASTGPGVSTGGNVRVGNLSHIGIGASILHGIQVGTNCVIGGKAFVDRDVGDNLVSFGVPARARHQREPGAAYL